MTGAASRTAAASTTGQRLTTSAEQTVQLGRELAQSLQAGDLVALKGDLGAGKTCLIQGIAEGLGVTEVVNSPTFVLLNVYEARGALRLYHFDLYRLSTSEELEDIGAVEFFHDPQGISLVEWADRVPELLPADRWDVCLAHGATADERTIHWQRTTAADGRNTE